MKLLFPILLLLLASIFLISQKQLSTCDESDWNCLCSRIKEETGCKSSFECAWTNFHSTGYYCSETSCKSYVNSTACSQHQRCVWLSGKNEGTGSCEESAYFDPDRH